MAIQLTTPGPPDGFLAVNYSESNFLSSSMRPDGQSFTLHVQVAPSDWKNFEIATLGFSTYNGVDRIIRIPPMVNYYRPWQVARTVDYIQNLSEPAQDTFGHLTYKGQIELALGFETPEGGAVYLGESARPAGPRLDELWRACSRRIEHEVTSQQLPRKALSYAAGAGAGLANQPIPAVGAVVLATATLYYTTVFPVTAASILTGVPKMVGALETNLQNGVGTINSATFDQKYPKYTILALAPKRELIWQADGSLAWKMTYIFAQRGTVDVSANDSNSATPDWTRILNGNADSATAYSRVNRTGAPTKFAYATSDLNLMFTP